ncbi:MAG: diguanylate cyclase [Coxiellaceae bacterium]|nr:diguanylate cyclase [Coxiellaceae bacterium]
MTMHTVLLIGAQDFSGFECWYRLPEVDLSHTACWSTVSQADRAAFDVVMVEYLWLVQLSTKDNIAFFSAFNRQPIIVIFDTTESIDRESLIAIGVQAVWSVEELQHIELLSFLDCAIERQRRLQALEDESRQVSALISKLKTMDVRTTDYVSGVTKILDSEWVEQSALMLKKVREQNSYLQQIVHHDGLTGLMTRDLFNEIFSTTLSRVQRHEKQIALLYMDVDNFKHVNDTFGHPVGDQLLQQVAQRLMNALRDEDLVARLGGDEFAVLLMEVNNATAAGLVARKLMTELSQKPYQIDEFEMNVTVSIGIACYPFAGSSVEELSKHADMALYRSKRAGRNRYQFFTQKINRQMVRRMTLERELEGAIEHDELSIVLQPIFNVSDSQCHMLKSCIDWDNRKYGQVSSKEFLPIAQQSHVMLDLGYWLMGQLIEKIAVWQQQSDLSSPVKYSLPLSVLQLSDRHFLSTFESMLTNHQVNPSRIVFEIKQEQWLHEQGVSIELLQPLVDMGCELSMVQFGVGTLDLDRLIEVPLRHVFVDAHYINCSADRAHSKMSLLTAIAHSMQCQVVVDGVQNLEELKSLQQQQVSGFALHPQSLLLPPDSVAQFLSRPDDPREMLQRLSKVP